jgi:hypothetical protein
MLPIISGEARSLVSYMPPYPEGLNYHPNLRFEAICNAVFLQIGYI